MRIKALLCAAALAAGIASTMAQVYSLNVVGYYNVTIPANSMQMIANQFNTTNNTLAALIPAPPSYTEFYKWSTGVGYTTYIYDPDEVAWLPDGAVTLNPGEGGFLKNVEGSPMTITFVGEVPQGNLTNGIPTGYSIRSSMVPQAGDVNTLGLPKSDYDELYKWTVGTGFTTYIYDPDEVNWLPSVPNIDVGEAFFLNSVDAKDWVRTFNVQ